jgi:hypothetical protein
LSHLDENTAGILCVLESSNRTIEFLVERGQRVTLVEGEFEVLSAKFKEIMAEATLILPSGSSILIRRGTPCSLLLVLFSSLL